MTHVRTTIDSPVGDLTLVASDAGLRAVLWEQDGATRVPLPADVVDDPGHPVLLATAAQLGDRADMPSEDDLLEVAPGLIERHGVGVVRIMLAAAVTGEAPASPAIIRILKHDETLALPAPAPVSSPPPVKAMSAEEAAERERIKERRKEERRQKQAEQAARHLN